MKNVALIQLKPCPFCGNKELRLMAIKSVNDKFVGYYILCEPKIKPCGTQGPIGDSDLMAHKKWNGRNK